MSEIQNIKSFLTIEDIEMLPEDKKVELIDGQIYMLSTPSTKHQDISRELLLEIGTHIRSERGACKVRSAPFAVYLNNDNSNYFIPDITIICDPNKVDEKGCHGAPDWIIEIIEPCTANKDCTLKLNKYLSAGVREYWIIDPETELIIVYNSSYEHAIYKFTDTIEVGIFDNFDINFKYLDL